MKKITRHLSRQRRWAMLGVSCITILLTAACVISAKQFLSQSTDITIDTIDELLTEAPTKTISIDLVGDVNFADGWGADYADAHDKSIATAFSPSILEHLQSADIFYANHEFTMSTHGFKLNKYFTFRADPVKVDYWQQLGVDVVGLANNHAYDYGEVAFLDTLDTLDSAGIKYVGAGRNLAEAITPAYFNIDGYKVAFVAADRSQKGSEPRAAAATDDTPGVLFCFDDTLFLEAVGTAHENADFVIAIPHWGTESSTVLEPIQLSLGQKLIDAGADTVIGAHPHILQGVDFYNGKFIAYSLGNFWFNWETIPTAVLNIEITGGEPHYKIIPALQSERQVTTSSETSIGVLNMMRQLSPNVNISDDGVVTNKQ